MNSLPNYFTTNSNNLFNFDSEAILSEWASSKSGTILRMDVVMCPLWFSSKQSAQANWFLTLTQGYSKHTAVTISPWWLSFCVQQNILLSKLYLIFLPWSIFKKIRPKDQERWYSIAMILTSKVRVALIVSFNWKSTHDGEHRSSIVFHLKRSNTILLQRSNSYINWVIDISYHISISCQNSQTSLSAQKCSQHPYGII